MASGPHRQGSGVRAEGTVCPQSRAAWGFSHQREPSRERARSRLSRGAERPRVRPGCPERGQDPQRAQPAEEPQQQLNVTQGAGMRPAMQRPSGRAPACTGTDAQSAHSWQDRRRAGELCPLFFFLH